MGMSISMRDEHGQSILQNRKSLLKLGEGVGGMFQTAIEEMLRKLQLANKARMGRHRARERLAKAQAEWAAREALWKDEESTIRKRHQRQVIAFMKKGLTENEALQRADAIRAREDALARQKIFGDRN
jgi:predicted ATPase